MKPILFVLLCAVSSLKAQTDIDALFMPKKNICAGVVGGYATWNHYWEGTLYRENLNIGSVNTKMGSVMANYGITDHVNIIGMLPYIQNEATSGTLHSQSGIQDLSLMLKHEFWVRKIGGISWSSVYLLGASAPMSNYVTDYLPLSIGLGSKNAMGRVMVDGQKNHWFVTGSASYMVRSNVQIDRTAYYTNEMIYSNLVKMPDMFGYNFRFGWRENADKIVELYLDGMKTLGGFDIRRNDMPFLSNTMNATRLGLNLKYPMPKIDGLSIVAAGNTTIAGRNMGQTHSFQLGFFYQTDFVKNEN